MHRHLGNPPASLRSPAVNAAPSEFDIAVMKERDELKEECANLDYLNKSHQERIALLEDQVEKLTTALVKLDSVIDFDVPAESDHALMGIRDPSAFNEAIESARQALTSTVSPTSEPSFPTPPHDGQSGSGR
jgi:cell division GTPase FtsZ